MKIEMRTRNGSVKLPDDRPCYVVDTTGAVFIGYPAEAYMPFFNAMIVTGTWRAEQGYTDLDGHRQGWGAGALIYADILRAVNPTPGDFHFDQDGMRFYGTIPG
jgi:hypothetical protein